MSKMSNINLMLQEQAEELGFSTTQEALDAGFTVDYTAKEPTLVFDNDKAQEQAHAEWLKEKEELLEKLRQLKGLEEYSKELMGDEYIGCGEIEVMGQAIKFIEGVSYE